MLRFVQKIHTTRFVQRDGIGIGIEKIGIKNSIGIGIKNLLHIGQKIFVCEPAAEIKVKVVEESEEIMVEECTKLQSGEFTNWGWL